MVTIKINIIARIVCTNMQLVEYAKTELFVIDCPNVIPDELSGWAQYLPPTPCPCEHSDCVVHDTEIISVWKNSKLINEKQPIG